MKILKDGMDMKLAILQMVGILNKKSLIKEKKYLINALKAIGN